jgi:hypothetical protein
VQGKKIENRDNALFTVCGVESFTAKELRNDIDSCLKKVSENATPAEIAELKIYMQRFLRDVDEEYPQQKYERGNSQ